MTVASLTDCAAAGPFAPKTKTRAESETPAHSRRRCDDEFIASPHFGEIQPSFRLVKSSGIPPRAVNKLSATVAVILHFTSANLSLRDFLATRPFSALSFPRFRLRTAKFFRRKNKFTWKSKKCAALKLTLKSAENFFQFFSA
ncbi:MAG TPA: hypothetical protein VKT73_14090 [Xanthobacteraceae bacterium]|nr:hypothetical protein [Xanthobacteraceae bacterium]